MITKPNLVASYSGLRFPTDVRVVGNYAYIADFLSSTADFKIINISTPTAPVLMSQSNATGNISDVDFSSGYVYAADGTSGLRVIDVSNPSSPNLKSTYNSPGDAQDVKIVGNYAYVADGTSGLQIVNISNPNSPILQGTAGVSVGVIGSVSSVDIVGNYAYIVNKLSFSGRLQIINISNPASPTKSGEYSFPLEGVVSNVQVLGNYAYVSAGNRGLKIIDISNPTSPVLKGEYYYNHTGEAYDVQVVGKYAYVAFGLYGLEIIDISNPSSPTLVGSFKPETKYYGMSVTNTVTSVEVVNNYAYLTVQASRDLGGLWILDISQFTNTNTFTGTPNADTLIGTTAADTLIGLAGNDTYTVNNAGDIVTEALNAGTDLVQASISYPLPNNVENLTLTGTINLNGTGNSLNNTLTGNSGNNTLTGNAGNDTLNGGAGRDTLTGGTGSDTFVFQFGQSPVSGADRITDFAIGTDKIDLLTASGGVLAAPTSFTRAANSTATTLTNVVNSVFTDANGALTGNQALGVNRAALVSVTTVGIAGTYLVINDGLAGFQSSNDLLVNITGYSGTLPALGTIAVSSFFI